jgi:hypothetical protein
MVYRVEMLEFWDVYMHDAEYFVFTTIFGSALLACVIGIIRTNRKR